MERFSIIDKTVYRFNQRTGEFEEQMRKFITLTNVNMRFAVVDENNVELQSYKYCIFYCGLRGSYVEDRTAVEGGNGRLIIPSRKEKTETEGTALISFPADRMKLLEFIPLNDARVNVTQGGSNEILDQITLNVSRLNYNLNIDSELPQMDVLRIVNSNSDLQRNDIVNRLINDGLIPRDMFIEYSETENQSADGGVELEFGSYDCDCTN